MLGRAEVGEDNLMNGNEVELAIPPSAAAVETGY